MLFTKLMLNEKYKNYADINGKIKRDLDQGKLFSVGRGLYESNPLTPGHFLAASIYGPSYLSFEYALSFHNLIPERVYEYSNATFNKRKSKVYTNHFGRFSYRDIPETAFPYFVEVFEKDNYVYFMASAEKALCDLLYTLSPVHSVKELKALLFENLRINPFGFERLNYNDIIFLADKYISTNIKFLVKLFESEEKRWQ